MTAIDQNKHIMKARILIVEDDNLLAYTFEQFLSREGHEVFTANDYNAALSRLDETGLDLIFADIKLGGKTGVDLLREVKKRNLRCPVVLITGNPDIDSAADAVRLGAYDYLPKPVKKEVILRVANLALQHNALINEKEEYRSNLEATFRSVKDAIITVDKELNVIAINKAAEEMFVVFGNDVKGKAFKHMCNGICLEAFRSTIRTKQPVETRRTECGSIPRRIFSLTTSPLLDSLNNFKGCVMVVKDETRLDNLERDLQDRQKFHNIIGKSEKMQKVYDLIEDLAEAPTTVLITGESGTGKELIADALHYQGNRKDMPIVRVNCSALPDELLESELFGHVKGAFTGAINDRIGRFEKANGGTIFLDEIGDISEKMQMRLLRVLQEKTFERVGDSSTIKVDVRVIASTNKNLREKVKQNEFREDLFYRLNVVELLLPPLRDRRDDIPLLTDHFIKMFNKIFNKDIKSLSDNAQKIFMNYSWPGNIRELQHSLEHSFVICRKSTIDLDDLPLELKDFNENRMIFLKGKGDDERQTIIQALKKTGWNKSKAAQLLGIDRRTVYLKVKKYNISPDDTM